MYGIFKCEILIVFIFYYIYRKHYYKFKKYNFNKLQLKVNGKDVSHDGKIEHNGGIRSSDMQSQQNVMEEDTKNNEKVFFFY